MSYETLGRRMQIRPIQKWPGELTPANSRRHSAFKASFNQTVKLLNAELYNIGATAIVLQIAMDEKDFRLDGLPRATAKPEHPGIVLGLNPKGNAGDRLEFATDVFTLWDDNLRGVALGLEALRKVDRYGITSGSQQYAGFKALTTGDDGCFGLYSERQAREFIDREYDGDVVAALKATHPDAGGDGEAFMRVMRAKELIAA